MRIPAVGANPEPRSRRRGPARAEQPGDRDGLVGHRDPHVEPGTTVRGDTTLGQGGAQPGAVAGVLLLGLTDQAGRGVVRPQADREILQQVTHPARPQPQPSVHPLDGATVAGQDGERAGRDRTPSMPTARKPSGESTRPTCAVAHRRCPRSGRPRQAADRRAGRPAGRAARRRDPRIALRPVGFCARVVTMSARAPRPSARAISATSGPSSSTRTGSAERPSAARRSRRLAQPGSSTITRSPGRRCALSARSMPSSAPLVTARWSAGTPSAVRSARVCSTSSADIAGSPYSSGAPARTGPGGRDGQQGRVRVAGRQIARARGHVEPEQRPGRGRRAVPHPGAAPPGGFDGAAIAQQAVGRGDGVGVHPELAGQFADRRQRVAGRQRARRDRLFDVGRYRFRTRTRYACIVLARRSIMY